ncbi:MAG: (Na+)-NQR maturation NqrM [Candidatus Symbiodolus clandestinus]
MIIFLLTFILLLAVVLAMASGYLLQKKRLRGSCGGLNQLGIDKICDCTTRCASSKQPSNKP